MATGTIQKAIDEYLAAWSSGDPAQILASLVEGGTYADPVTNGPLAGEALAHYAGVYFQAFPDVRFELVSLLEGENGRVAMEWRLLGTNTGSFMGGPATGKAVDLPGADIIQIEGDKVRSVQGYFDTGTLMKQLGLA